MPGFCWALDMTGGSMATLVTKEGQRILVVGRSAPLMEGVSDLLQVMGYPVETSSSWMETEYAMHDRPPSLVIADLSIAPSDVYKLAEHIRSAPHWTDVPILFISFSGDNRIRELQRYNKKRNGNGNGRLHYYAHTLLSMDELLQEVEACLPGPH
jgi:CheY-like chemotaxis protein